MPKTKSQTKLKLQNQNFKKWFGVLNIGNWNLFDSWDLEIGIFNVNPRRGFTLIEMLISLGIMGILAAATLSTITQSRDQVRLNQSVQEIAALFREAQARALGVTEFVPDGGTGSFPGFGVITYKAFDGVEDAFRIFPDLDHNGFTPGSAAEREPVSEYNLPAGIVISEINDGASTDHISFIATYNRPDPSVTFQVSGNAAGATNLNPTLANVVMVCLGAPRENVYKIISVWKTGQVAVSETQDSCSI